MCVTTTGFEANHELTTAANNVSIYNNILAPRTGELALNIRLRRSDLVVDPRTISENNNLFDVPRAAISVGWGDARGTLAGISITQRQGWGSAALVGDPRFTDE